MLVDAPPGSRRRPDDQGGTSRRSDVRVRATPLLRALVVPPPVVTAKSHSVGGNQHRVMKAEREGALSLAKVKDQ
jgi:hypothetical protein